MTTEMRNAPRCSECSARDYEHYGHFDNCSQRQPPKNYEAVVREHTCTDEHSQPTGLFCVACVEEREKSKQTDQTATPTADNWRVNGKFVSDCEQTLSGMYAVYGEDDRFVAAFSEKEEAQRVVDEHSAVARLTTAVEALRQRHREKAIRCNFNDCGCDDCLALDQTLTTLRSGSVRE